MLDASITGKGQPRQRSINVDSNLLAEWLADRQRAKAHNRVAVGLLLLAVVVGAAVLPALGARLGRAAWTAGSAHARLSRLEAQLQRARATAEGLKPVLDDRAMAQQLQARSDTFYGRVTLLINTASPDLTFTKLKAEVAGAQFSARILASASSYASAQSFVDAVGRGPGGPSSFLVSTKKSPSLGPQSVSFEHLTKVVLEP